MLDLAAPTAADSIHERDYSRAELATSMNTLSSLSASKSLISLGGGVGGPGANNN